MKLAQVSVQKWAEAGFEIVVILPRKAEAVAFRNYFVLAEMFCDLPLKYSALTRYIEYFTNAYSSTLCAPRMNVCFLARRSKDYESKSGQIHVCLSMLMLALQYLSLHGQSHSH